MVVAALTACVAEPGASGAPVESATADTALPVATLLVGQTPASQPTPEPEPSGALPGPITYAPDSIWAFLATTPGQENAATTLEEATHRAEAVVVGRFVDLEPGNGYGAPGEPVGWYAIAIVEPQVVVKGPVHLIRNRLRIPFLMTLGPKAFPEKEFADMSRSLPADPALLFVDSWATFFGRFNAEVPAWLDPLDRDDSYRTIGGDGAIRVVGGRLEPPLYNDGWPAALRGATLPDAVSRIQATLVASSPIAKP